MFPGPAKLESRHCDPHRNLRGSGTTALQINQELLQICSAVLCRHDLALEVTSGFRLIFWVTTTPNVAISCRFINATREPMSLFGCESFTLAAQKRTRIHAEYSPISAALEPLIIKTNHPLASGRCSRGQLENPPFLDDFPGFPCKTW